MRGDLCDFRMARRHYDSYQLEPGGAASDDGIAGGYANFPGRRIPRRGRNARIAWASPELHRGREGHLPLRTGRK